jgi:long-chain fatty acid transport protein
MRRLGLALVALALTLSGRATANPVDTYGLGSRSTAMGGAVSADVTDFSACYYNPSGLALARGMDFSIGYMRAHHSMEMNGEDSKVDPVHGLVGGIVAPGSIGFLPFAFGIATHLSDERLSRARTMKVEEPRWVFYDNRPQLLYISADLAIRPFDWLAVGGGVTFLAATRGGFGITGTAVLPAGSTSEYDSQLRHEVDADLSSVRYPVFGITLRPSEMFDIGLVYRGEAKVELDIDAELEGDIDATILKVPARYTLVSHTANIFIPRQVVFGTSVHPMEKLHVNLDLTWVNWAAYESPISETRTVLDVNVPPSLGLELPPNPKPTKAAHPGFKNRIVPRLGVEYRAEVARRKLHLPLRVGYLYEHSPVPDQTGITNYVDTHRHAISAGTGLIWEEPGAVLPGDLRLDFHGQFSILPTRVTKKDSPADYIGDYRAKGTILSAGATLSVGFR